jgi:SOS regulatory protein LexA
MMTFGARLRMERDRLKLTQLQFAALGGVKRVSQHLYEQDVRVPDVNYLLRLQQHDVDVGFLVCGAPSILTGLQSGASLDLFTSAFRSVDEFARDARGEPLALVERERFFHFLCMTLLSHEPAGDISDLRLRLANFMRQRASVDDPSHEIRLVPPAPVISADILELPLIGRVAAGQPILSDGCVERTVAIGRHLFRPRADYLLRVEGESMSGVGVMNGDWVAVHRTPDATTGQIVVARIDGEITIKRFRRIGERIVLAPENPAYQPITIGADTDDFAIEGLYVGSIRIPQP